MTCNEIENRLPAYREGLLTPGEQKSISGHLAGCPRCSRAMADLGKAEKLLQELAEVEPPPFFEQRIMSRVREEAGRKQGILRRLFYPLHIKVPVQVLATLVVAVLAFHVYQQGDPEMKRMATLPLPMTEQEKGRGTAESPKTLTASPAVKPKTEAPAGELTEISPRGFAAPPVEKRGPEAMIADSRAPIREEAPAAAKPAVPFMAAKEKDASPAATPRSTLELTLTIRVSDPGSALGEIESCLGRVSARMVERQRRSEGEYLKADVPAQNVAALLDLLEAVGRVNRESDPPTLSAGTVIISITIIPHP